MTIEDWFVMCDPIAKCPEVVEVAVEISATSLKMRECSPQTRLPVTSFKLKFAAFAEQADPKAEAKIRH